MSDIYDEATADSTFLSDRNSRLWNFFSTDGDESSIDHLLTTYGMVPQAVIDDIGVHRSNGGRGGGSINHVDTTVFNSASDPSISVDLWNEVAGCAPRKTVQHSIHQ